MKLIKRGVIGFIGGGICLHFVVVLFGAPLNELIKETLLLSMWISSLISVPTVIYIGFRPIIWRRIFVDFR